MSRHNIKFRLFSVLCSSCRQAEFAAQKKEHEELLATDIRLEKEIAKARQRRDDIKQEVTSLETRKSDLLEEITSQGRILCDLEEKNQKLRGQGTATGTCYAVVCCQCCLQLGDFIAVAILMNAEGKILKCCTTVVYFEVYLEFSQRQ